MKEAIETLLRQRERRIVNHPLNVMTTKNFYKFINGYRNNKKKQ